VAIEVVFETHSTTVDNEEGRATGWLPGQLPVPGRPETALGRPARPGHRPHRHPLGPGALPSRRPARGPRRRGLRLAGRLGVRAPL